MKNFRSLLAAAIAVSAFSAAHAQDEAVTVRVHSGNVMTSQGGEFVTAASGAPIAPGSRIMLAENSSASLVYPNGCTQDLSAAGVHPVAPVCQATGSRAAIGSGTAAGVDWGSAGLLFLGTAVVAAGLSQMSDGDPLPPPVSR